MLLLRQIWALLSEVGTIEGLTLAELQERLKLFQGVIDTRPDRERSSHDGSTDEQRALGDTRMRLPSSFQ